MFYTIQHHNRSQITSVGHAHSAPTEIPVGVPHSRFSRKFSRSAFLTILELGKGYKCCSSLYVSVYIHVACGSCVICKRRGRYLSGLYFYISVGTHNNVIKRRTWSVVFAAVLAIRKCFWLWISSILPRNLNKVKYQLQNRSENRVKGIFQCRLTVSPVSLLLSAMRAYRKYVSVWLFTVNPTCLTWVTLLKPSFTKIY